MTTLSTADTPIDPNAYPALAGLGLTVADLATLAQRGSLVGERRGDCQFVKLRYRQGGRHRARYVGDERAAARIAEELTRLRAPRAQLRNLHRLGQAANRELRQRRAALEPLLAAHGFQFHGRAIRRKRDY